MYKEDLALNKLQWLICHKTQPNQTIITRRNAHHIYMKISEAKNHIDFLLFILSDLAPKWPPVEVLNKFIRALAGTTALTRL